MRFSGDYEREQAELEEQAAALQTELEGFEADSVRADKFIEVVKKYTTFDVLTTAMLNEFVQKVVVYESDKSSGERIQQVDVYLNFIGKFDVPEPEPTPEELAEIEKQRQRRAKFREYNRKYYAKKKRQELTEQDA